MYSLVLLVACYIDATGDYENFWQHVFAVTYGDDNVVNPDNSVRDMFNQVSVSKLMLENYAMVYTPGKKDGNFVPYTVLQEVTFLQRGFRFEDGKCLAPLALDSFLFTPYWGKNKLLREHITVSCMELALLELSQHPAETWAAYAPAIIHFLRVKTGVTKTIPTRAAYQALALKRADAWY